MTEVDEPGVDAGNVEREAARLAEVLDGWVSRPGEEAYAAARRTFNGLVNRHPLLAVSCRSVEDVRRAFDAAAHLGVAVSVRGGGHSVAGHGVGAGSVLVDLSQLREVSVDADRRIASVAGGAIWNDVDPATQRHGLAVPGGTFGDTGVGGLTLGGGIGWLIGTAGLTCDNLVRAEVVTPAGDVVVAAEDQDADLLWALRGGGGNFGVVTRFELALHERGPMVGGEVLFPVGEVPGVLEGAARLVHEAPDELVVQPAVRLGTEHSRGGCSVMFAFAGGEQAARPWVEAVRGLGTSVAEGHGPMSYEQVQAMNELLPFGLRHYWSGHFVTDLLPETVAALGERLDPTPGLNTILFEPISGRARRIDPDSAAFPARSARWNITGLGVWDDPRHDDEQVAWARSVSQAVAPWSLGGGYVNYAPHDQPSERTAAAFGPARWERLRAVKRRHDPGNVLRHNANVAP